MKIKIFGFALLLGLAAALGACEGGTDTPNTTTTTPGEPADTGATTAPGATTPATTTPATPATTP
ncbi:hypothetical protein [Fischerella thermalis]|uniref:hypothetical protein n=1 Tax=Fischerella thermalis TaxID=372787 RepID=UPI000C7F893C|nr:hypothetical protein [Fischerella thermalis]PLZ06070.1 hypothetical protein CBP18_19435 [Fischerella thermalis WC119]PMB53871.1 hypothetical protein CEN39_02045 [Fischerella thermalis CCMEE 5201]